MSARRRMARRRGPAPVPGTRRPPGSARAALFVSTLGLLSGAVIASGAVYVGVTLLKSGGWVRPAMAFVLAMSMLLLAIGCWRGVRRRQWPDDRFLFAAAAAMAGMVLLRLLAG